MTTRLEEDFHATKRISGPPLELLVAMAIAYGCVVVAGDEPGVTPQKAWEDSYHLRTFYIEHAARFLDAFHQEKPRAL